MNTTSFNSYLSNHIYENLVPKNHFLRKLDEIIDWYELTFDLKTLGKNDHGGRPRYAPVLLFKMLFLSFLYDTSDRDTAEFCAANLYAKCFLGLPIDKAAPDFTTLSVFRNEIQKKMGEEWISSLLRQIIITAKRAGIKFSAIYALDATHTLSDVDIYQDNERQDKGLSPRDPEARWGVKGTEIKMTPEGNKVEVLKSFYGYKAHLISETGHGLVTALEASPGNMADINAGEDLLINQLNDTERKEMGIITADKAYGDGVLIGILERDYGLKTALGLNGQFFKGKHRKHWEAYRDDPERVAAKKKRSAIERVNADLKNNHGLRRCRYLGLAKYRLQVTMAALAHNLKILTRLITGARFRPI